VVAVAFGRGDGDGWVWCDQGHRHWGRFGAAGLLIRSWAPCDGDARIVLQHRALWSHQGGTWGLPGGARDSHESPVGTALREAEEEAGLPASSVRPTGLLVDDHGGWSYTTVVAEQAGPLEPAPTGGESIEVRWIEVDEVDRLPLHPGFAATWPRLRRTPAGTLLVVDGANVVGARGRGDGWWRDRAGAARRLRDALVGLAVRGIPAGRLPPPLPPGGLDTLLPWIVLVVEGAARSIAAEPLGAPPAATPPGRPPKTAPPPDPAPPRSPPHGPPLHAPPPHAAPATDPPTHAAPAAAVPPTAAPGGTAGGTPPTDTSTDRAMPALRPAAPHPPVQLEVIAADRGGDDTIVAIAATAADGAHRALVITADRALAARVAAVGAATAGPSWLLRLIEPDLRSGE